jgi:hypothetical protein
MGTESTLSNKNYKFNINEKTYYNKNTEVLNAKSYNNNQKAGNYPKYP